jgi:hypothetical protein
MDPLTIALLILGVIAGLALLWLLIAVLWFLFVKRQAVKAFKSLDGFDSEKRLTVRSPLPGPYDFEKDRRDY